MSGAREELIPGVVQRLVQALAAAFPDLQAVYLFGSCATGEEGPDSDLDLALLLPPERAKAAGALALHPVVGELARIAEREVDLINLRGGSTVLQKEVLASGQRVACVDRYAAEEFEMLTLSYYGKLNEERSGIIAQAMADGRFLKP